MIDLIKADIEETYDQKPIILFAEESMHEILIGKLGLKKLRFKNVTNHTDMYDIKGWNYGLVLVSHSASRFDIVFQKDALVLITCPVGSYNELIQMQGRSSRKG